TSCTPGVPAPSSLSQSAVAAHVRPSGRSGAERGLSLNRFFKSALFPIVIVVLLAWLAQKYVLPGSSTKTTNAGWSTFVSSAQEGQIQHLKVDQGNFSIVYTLRNDPADVQHKTN